MSPARTETVRAPHGEAGAPGEERLSDAQLTRLLRIVLGAVTAIAVTLGGVLAVRWVAGPDEAADLGVVDIGFLQDMIDHHEQALLIANTYLAVNPTGGAAPYASEVVLFQTREMERMEGWLADAGLERGASERTAMAWMGMGGPVATMPGMQSAERIAELAAATGAAADRLFFEVMSAHHTGGAHMADFAAQNAQRDEVRVFAEKMSYNQQIEVVEYAQAVRRLGLGA